MNELAVDENTPASKALFMSFLVILVSEIGDKTFLIAAVMAMQHSRLLIFSAAMGALVVMTVLSAVMGQILPQILSKQYTDITAAFLFFVFGLKLLFDTLKMTGNECMEELEEVTQELLLDSEKKQEEGNSSSTSPYWRIPGLSPVWIQTFVMTFLAEWGDRSQIATVALSGSQNAVWVVMGGLGGHAICSGVAVVGGRLLASRISPRTVSIFGGILFLMFGLTGLYRAYTEFD